MSCPCSFPFSCNCSFLFSCPYSWPSPISAPAPDSAHTSPPLLLLPLLLPCSCYCSLSLQCSWPCLISFRTSLLPAYAPLILLSSSTPAHTPAPSTTLLLTLHITLSHPLSYSCSSPTPAPVPYISCLLHCIHPADTGQHSIQWRRQHICLLHCLREAIHRKNLLPFGIFPNGLDPPPLYFWNASRNFFKTLLKFLKVFGFGHPSLFSLENV